ncbi:MAG: MATE family efflux transporter, partial [Clostridiales bacterium]|nr:MATE family efflux transporter [Clostridiales bacterium]
MSRRTDMDMTVGKPLSIILKFTWPLFLGNIIQQLYNIVDTIIVGRFVGDRALAAVGSTGTLMFLFIGVANGMVTGFSVLTSQRYGAKEEEGVKKTFTNGIYLCILLATIQTLFSILFLKPLLIWMNTPDTIFDYAYAYISTITLGITATVFNNYFASLLRAIGNSKMPLFFLMMSAGINIVLDLVFIIVFGWETFGAAIATVISQACSAVAGACY